MTKEEAISRLEQGAPFSEVFDKSWEEAVSMAISALKPTCKIDESNFSMEQYRADLQCAYDCGKAKALKGGWIPVAERLPEERHTYEVTLQGIGELEGIDNEVAYATWLGNKNNRENNWLYHDVNNWKDKEVIAWKPRSKPYKAESEVAE